MGMIRNTCKKWRQGRTKHENCHTKVQLITVQGLRVFFLDKEMIQQGVGQPHLVFCLLPGNLSFYSFFMILRRVDGQSHLLKKVKHVNFTEEERQQLLRTSKEVFLGMLNKKHARQMEELLTPENMRSILNDQASMPEIDENGMIIIRSSELEGSFETPGFGNPEYNIDFYSRPHSFHYVLDLPDNMGEKVGEGVLVVTVETEGEWSFISPENRLELNREKLSFSEAQKLCISKGGHLASVG